MTNRAPLDTFETALLGELREHVADRRTTSTAPTSWRRRLVALAAVAATAVAGFALRPDPAFAVDAKDGDIVVTISSLEDADGLEQALADKGVTADVDYESEVQPPPEDLTDQEERDSKGGGVITEKGQSPTLDHEPKGECVNAISTSMSDGAVTFRFPKSAADSDSVLKIMTAGSADGPSSIAIRWEGDPC